jgi:hypothetical protein
MGELWSLCKYSSLDDSFSCIIGMTGQYARLYGHIGMLWSLWCICVWYGRPMDLYRAMVHWSIHMVL